MTVALEFLLQRISKDQSVKKVMVCSRDKIGFNFEIVLLD